MATRKRNDDESGSLDSLMDTLTNVVGILIIILASIQLDVSSTVQRIQGIDSEATPEALASLRTKADEVAKKRDDLAVRTAELDPVTVQDRIDQMLANIDKLKEQIKDPDKEKQDPEKLAAEAETLKTKVDEVEAQLVKAEETIAERKSHLSEMKTLSGPPAKVVQLPNPRDPPKGLKPIMFVCKDERVSWIDVDAAVKYAVDIIQKRAALADKLCDCEKAIKLFEDEKLGDEDFRLHIREINKTPHLVIEHVEGKGTMTRQIHRSTSEFGRTVAQINPQANYARFLVWSDSYEAYLAARKVCDERNILAGWQPYDQKAEWLINLGPYFHCKGYVPPPPPKNPPPPAPPGRPRPVDTVD